MSSKPNGAAKKNGAARREISVAEAAARVGISGRTMLRLLAERETRIHSWRLSDRGWLHIDAASLDRFMETRKRRNYAGGKR